MAADDISGLLGRKPIMRKAYRFANGMVIAFDELGQQMPEYQGRFEDVVDKIRQDFPDIEIRLGEVI